MKSINITSLDNGIRLITKENPNTPRTAVNLFIKSRTCREDKAGTAGLMSRLLMQGTTNRNASKLAAELDINGIEMNIDIKQDYTKIKCLFLNEDFDKALDILSDIVLNSTFNEFEKEKIKFKGEIDMELDSPKTKAFDNLVRNVFVNHPYGNTLTRIVEDIDKISLNEVKSCYTNSITADSIIISAVGDFDENRVKLAFNEKLRAVSANSPKNTEAESIVIPENKILKITKEDAAQAQVVQGWTAPTVSDKDFPPMVLLNMILGSSGLSSRLFLELRDKKGLAYHVRSSYEPFKHSGLFSIYIGTSPENIKTAVEGFNIEIEKMCREFVSDEELENAKENYLGKRAFFHETNSGEAHYLGYFDVMGLGADFDLKIPELISAVTKEQIMDCANNYLKKNSILSLLASDKHLILF